MSPFHVNARRVRSQSPATGNDRRPARKKPSTEQKLSLQKASNASRGLLPTLPLAAVTFHVPGDGCVRLETDTQADRHTAACVVDACNQSMKAALESGDTGAVIDLFEALGKGGNPPDATSFSIVMDACGREPQTLPVAWQYLKQAVRVGVCRESLGYDGRSATVSFRAGDVFYKPPGNPDAALAPGIARAIATFNSAWFTQPTRLLTGRFGPEFSRDIQTCMCVAGQVPLATRSDGDVCVVTSAYRPHSPRAESRCTRVVQTHTRQAVESLHAEEAWACVQQMRASGPAVALNSHIATALIKRCTVESRAEGVDAILAMMHADGETPNIAVFNALITAYRKFKRTDAAIACFEQAKQAGLEPDQQTLRAVLQACAQGKRGPQAQAIFQEWVSGHQSKNTDAMMYLWVIEALDRPGSLSPDSLDILLSARQAGHIAKAMGFTTSQGESMLDFHREAVLEGNFSYDRNAPIVQPSVALALFAHHWSEGRINNETMMIVGDGERIADAIEASMRDCGMDPVRLKGNPGVLISSRRQCQIANNTAVCKDYQAGRANAGTVQKVTTSLVALHDIEGAWACVSRMQTLTPPVPLSSPCATALLARCIALSDFRRLDDIERMMNQEAATLDSRSFLTLSTAYHKAGWHHHATRVRTQAYAMARARPQEP